MQGILEEVDRGNILSGPRFFEPGTHYGRVMEVLADCEKRLETVLDEEGREIFEEFNKSQIEIELLIGIEKFVHGYRLGVLMAGEVFNGKNDSIVSEAGAA